VAEPGIYLSRGGIKILIFFIYIYYIFIIIHKSKVITIQNINYNIIYVSQKM
jgi:hypothetical protein